MKTTFDYRSHLDWIDTRQTQMEHWTAQWAGICSGSRYSAGLARMAEALQAAFAPLQGKMTLRDCDPIPFVDEAGEPCQWNTGRALHIVKRPEAVLRVFLGGHMDTVFDPQHAFQTVRRLDDGRTMNGPGVADLKGGLAVMLTALMALERSPFAGKIGWEVLINPDEEIGSLGSARLLAECGRRNQVGLLFEPALADGRLAAARKGSGNFTVVMRGLAAHAGREFHLGYNAIAALAEYTQALWALNGRRPDVTINPGRVSGGGALNIVPDLAILGFNARVADAAGQQWLAAALDALDQRFAAMEGICVARHGGFTRPPKPITAAQQRIMAAVADCGRTLNLPVAWHDTGGCCDGNNLAAVGLPNVDTLGVRGGGIHSDREFIVLASLAERAKLSALLLMRLAGGEVTVP
ncbi:MAG: hydrolase [Desulfatitalea sp.]|nr:hydrolase [Desulfatitalea sp.]